MRTKVEAQAVADLCTSATKVMVAGTSVYVENETKVDFTQAQSADVSWECIQINSELTHVSSAFAIMVSYGHAGHCRYKADACSSRIYSTHVIH